MAESNLITVDAAQRQAKQLQSEAGQITRRQGRDSARLEIIQTQLASLQPLIGQPAPAPAPVPAV